MSILCCFTSSSMEEKKLKKYKGEKDEVSIATIDTKKIGIKTLKVRLEQPANSVKASDAEDMKSASFTVPLPFSINPSARCNVKVMRYEGSFGAEEERAYEGEDEDGNNHRDSSVKRDFEASFTILKVNSDQKSVLASNSSDMEVDDRASDPGTRKAAFWEESPVLKRSCSNLETRNVVRRVPMVPSKPGSFEELHTLERENIDNIGSSPVSVVSRCSADKVILKKHSSTQILPSKSKRLWWKLFLWSHRNLTKRENKQGGYCSDSLEPNRRTRMNNHWVAFSTESRVDEWVKEIPNRAQFENDENPTAEESRIFFPPSPARSSTSRHQLEQNKINEDVIHANSVIQSLNSSSTVAHISGIGLKVIPSISRFSRLRTVNLSGNSIVHITPGSLPKSLHTLDLSRNKISTIEGLRDLTHLRILHLSYNRISRIGQGLANCTLIKELYLAGNKISFIEGLHRLLKLVIVDLSFNKIATSKALGQLVANYNSLHALNLLGNPIQSNMGDERLRKTLSGLLPKLAYLNKQPINPQRAREMATEAIARAALGRDDRSPRKAGKRASRGGSGSSSSTRHRSGASSIASKSRHGTKTRIRHHSSLKTTNK